MAKKLLNPYPVPQEDPYQHHINTTRSGVCGVKYKDDSKRYAYELITYKSTQDANIAGAHVTHSGDCGLCSTLEDLAAYMRNFDMTSPVRSCGLKGTVSQKWALNCLEALGLTTPCAKIWFYNTRNTRKECLLPCIKDINKPYNLPDGSLNTCLECDETKSGPVFKKVAARTRRDSGLESAIHRPPDSISHITHYYY
uniref:Uncharacterized protein n=1 Tax=Lotharella oceanica TaxID=641309 RepID=A0A7S2TRH7_9EUKA